MSFVVPGSGDHSFSFGGGDESARFLIRQCPRDTDIGKTGVLLSSRVDSDVPASIPVMARRVRAACSCRCRDRWPGHARP